MIKSIIISVGRNRVNLRWEEQCIFTGGVYVYLHSDKQDGNLIKEIVT